MQMIWEWGCFWVQLDMVRGMGRLYNDEMISG